MNHCYLTRLAKLCLTFMLNHQKNVAVKKERKNETEYLGSGPTRLL